jgi:hypothetical protein
MAPHRNNVGQAFAQQHAPPAPRNCREGGDRLAPVGVGRVPVAVTSQDGTVGELLTAPGEGGYRRDLVRVEVLPQDSRRSLALPASDHLIRRHDDVDAEVVLGLR